MISTELLRSSSRELVRELGLLNANPCLPSLSLTDGHLLIEISDKPDQTISSLSKRLILDHSTISRALSKLSNQGLIRLKPGVEDKRQKAVTITPKGKQTLQKLHEISNQIVEGALKQLPDNQQKIVAEGLSLYSKALAKARIQSPFSIRKISKKDNSHVAKVIRSVMSEYGATAAGFAIHDPEVDRMFETYNNSRSAFYVVEHDANVVGCAGVAPLKGEEKTTCEIQKMYFLKEARGKGLGEKLLRTLISDAKDMGFTKSYLETTSNMREAHKLYEKVGFKRRKSSLGCTGHFACEVWYELDLD